MITQIRLQDFMSHTDTVLQLAEGLTVLIGPNNCGKSAVVAALQAVCENTRSDFMVRHGAREARVTVTTSDGDEIVWIRRKEWSAYEINGKRYDRLQGGAPEDLHRLLRLPRVKIDDETGIDVHIAPQKMPIFLLNDPGSRPAAFFASSSDAGRLIEMQRLHNRRRLDREREKSRLQASLREADEALIAMEGLDAIRQRADEADTLRARIERDEERIRHLARLLADLEAALQSHGIQERRTQVLAGMSVPPSLADAGTLHAHLTAQAEAERAHRRWAARAACLAPIVAPPRLADALPLDRMILDLSGAQDGRERHAGRHAVLAPLTDPPRLAPCEPFARHLRELESAATVVHGEERRISHLDRLREPPSPANTAPLMGVLTELERLQSAVEGIESGLAEAVRETGDVESAIGAWARANPVCPTCGAPVSAESLLRERAHAG